MSFDTGDNPPLSGSALKRACELLIATHRGGLIKPVRDGQGIYAYLMREPLSNQPYYLVARNTPPMITAGQVRIVSTQRALVNIAAEERYPILLSWWPNKKHSEPTWMLYNPEEIKVKAWSEDQFNQRLGSKMINYEYMLGEMIQSPRDLPEHWTRLKRRWEEKKVGPIQTSLGGDYEIALKHPSLPLVITCTKCGATFSRQVFDECPGCGESLYPQNAEEAVAR